MNATWVSHGLAARRNHAPRITQPVEPSTLSSGIEFLAWRLLPKPWLTVEYLFDIMSNLETI